MPSGEEEGVGEGDRHPSLKEPWEPGVVEASLLKLELELPLVQMGEVEEEVASFPLEEGEEVGVACLQLTSQHLGEEGVEVEDLGHQGEEAVEVAWNLKKEDH
jgi:predicted RNA-binding protein with TRAM domain